MLASAFNHMLDRLTDAFASQRAFIADASHELGTPLTAIRGQLEVLAGHAQHTMPRRSLVRLDVEHDADGQLRFTMQDAGPGIPSDQRERVFGRLGRTDAARIDVELPRFALATRDTAAVPDRPCASIHAAGP